MAVVTRRRGVRVLVLVASAVPLLLAGGAALLTVLLGGTCSGGGGVGDAPSAAATRDIPGAFLRIYSRSGRSTRSLGRSSPGSVGRSAIRAVIPIRRARRSPGRGVLGSRTSRARRGRCRSGSAAPRRRVRLGAHDLPDPSLGPHDPTAAVELAALVLIKDKGAPAGQPIAAYALYVREYNGSGPAADAYAARVLADAHAYQGAGRWRSARRAPRRWARRSCPARGEDPCER